MKIISLFEKNADLSLKKKKLEVQMGFITKGFLMAERMGFEPMKGLLLYTLSKRAPSTTRPPLHIVY